MAARMNIALTHPSLGSADADTLRPYLRAARYVESTDALDGATVVLSLPDQSEPPDALRPALAPGGALTLTLLEGEAEVRAITLDVVSVRHSRRPRAPVSLHLQALEPLQRVRGINVTQITSEGGELLSLLCQVAKEATGGSVSSPSVKDEASLGVAVLDRPLLGALKRGARQRGLVICVELGQNGTPKITFEREHEGETLELSWARDIRELEMTLDLSRQVTGVEVYGLPDPTLRSQADADPAPGKAPRRPASATTLTGASLVSGWKVSRVLALEAWTRLVEERPLAESEIANPCRPSALESEASRVFVDISRRFVAGRMVARGQPQARANGQLRLSEAPWPYDGTLFVTEVQHHWSADEPLLTEIGFNADAVGKP